jgi:hypothetical protein
MKATTAIIEAALLAVMGLLALWFALRAWSLARRWPTAAVLTFTGIGLIIAAVFFFIRTGATNGWGAIDWLAAIYGLIIPFVAGGILRWLFRGRWLGELLLDASGARQVWPIRFAVAYLLLVCGAISFDLAAYPRGHSITFLALSFATALILLWNSLKRGKLEFRQRGIAGPDLFCPWRQTAAWSWEAGALLRLEFSQPRLFRRSVRLPVPPSKVNEVEAVLNRFLGDRV